MSKKLIIDINNFPIGFYDTNINLNIPNDAIDITDQQWNEFLDNPNTRKWNTTTLSIDIFEDSTILNNKKEKEKSYIDSLSEIQRLKYITVGTGQSLTYQEKSEEASDYIVAGSPIDLSSYPYIQAEVNATGKTANIAANDILSAQSAWITKGALIEEYRIKAKIDIDAATTISNIDIIVAAFKLNIELV